MSAWNVDAPVEVEPTNYVSAWNVDAPVEVLDMQLKKAEVATAREEANARAEEAKARAEEARAETLKAQAQLVDSETRAAVITSLKELIREMPDGEMKEQLKTEMRHKLLALMGTVLRG